MRRYLLYLIVLALCSTSGLAQTRAGRPRPGAAGDIRRFDFRNFSYRAAGELLRVSEGRGVYQSSGDETFSFDVERVMVAYGDVTGDGSDEAAVTVYYTGGGTGAFSKGFLFALQGGRLKLLTTFEGGDRADGGINEVRIEGGALIVRRNEPERMNGVPVGLCCPVYLITAKYRWDGRRLVRVGEPQKVEIKEGRG